MTLALVRDALLWCTLINYGILLVWWLFFLLAHDWMHRLHGKWFQLSREQFDALHYAGMAIFKLTRSRMGRIALDSVVSWASGSHPGWPAAHAADLGRRGQGD